MRKMSYIRMSFLAMTALLAAGPLSAQIRLGAVGEAGANGAAGASVSGTLAGPVSPALAPALGAASLNVSLAAPVISPAAKPTAVQAAASPVVSAALPRDEAVRATLEALSPEKLGKISGESAKALSGRLLGLEEASADAGSAGAVAGRFAAAAPGLEPSDRGGVESAREPLSPAAPSTRPGLLGRAEIRLHHLNRWLQEYYWYSVTHIVDMWPSYKARWAKAQNQGTINVSRPRAFFSHMRVAGTSGKFYVLGISPLEDEAVITALRQAYLMWFDGRARGPMELAAFDRFSDRALLYNAERRAPTNMRKHLRDALIKAATMKPSEVAPFFDSLLVEETARETADFQNKGEQKRILDAFRQAVLDTLAEEPAGDRAEVLGALLMGSFASGSAGPKSDLDLEVFTRGGRERRVPGFTKRLTDRWTLSGLHARNPVGVHEHPYKPLRGVVDMVHAADYIVISRDAALVERLQRKPGEPSKFAMLRRHTAGGAMGRVAQAGLIYASTFLGDLKSSLGIAPSGH